MARPNWNCFLSMVIIFCVLTMVNCRIGLPDDQQKGQHLDVSPPAYQKETNKNDLCSYPDVFHCTSGDDHHCIPADQKCNGVAECEDGQDESVQECGCLDNEFYCNETCIDLLVRCDTKYDCDDHSDEQNCETFSCMFSYFKCQNHFCIQDNLVCDFNDDCGDNSDEVNCAHRNCWFGEYQCDNGECIRAAYLCDGTQDCKDASDETYCDLKKNFVECGDGSRVHQYLWCDNWPDCKDNHADELNCRTCTEREFRCENSRCISKGNVCDGICDCAETCDDENDCDEYYHLVEGTEIPICHPSTTISCKGTDRCISAQSICDGINDCQKGDPSADEHGCHERNLTLSSIDQSELMQCPDDRDRRFIPATLRCDFQNDCLNGFDELGCDFPQCDLSWQFRCHNDECIDRSLRCDTFYNCRDRSDEINCFDHVCPTGFFQCQTGQCIPEFHKCDYHRDCPDDSDETDCSSFSQPCTADQFQCLNGQCVRKDLVCYRDPSNPRLGCADKSHLRNCKDFQCDPSLFKCRNGFCIDRSLICNHVIDCPGTGTDEEGCPFQCSNKSISLCECHDITINCTNSELTIIPSKIEKEISKVVLSGNYLNNALHPNVFQDLGRLSFLDLSNNSLVYIQPLTFQHLHRLKILLLQDNRLVVIRNETFFGLGVLATLNLERNLIRELEPFAFYGLSSLQTLDLHHQQINKINQNAFVGLRHLRKLNLSNNKIAFLMDGVFNGMTDLQALDISSNSIQTIGIHVFHGFRSLQNVRTDEFRFCCVALHVTNCYPEPDEFSSCKDLMSNIVLRVCIWALGVVAFAGNFMVIIWRIIYRTNNKVHSFLITNLAFGDMLMGAYLLVIAAMDAKYRGVYFNYDSDWRQSALCHFVGFVSTFSSELSVFTLTVITLDRFVSIIFPFRLKRLKMKQTRIVMAAIWVVVCFLAGLPLCNIDYFRNFYGRSGVCLALHITNEKYNGWEYSVFVFLALNFVSFTIIAMSYVWMYAVARKTHRAVRSPEMKRDTTMAKRMTLIVFTDFCCWMPIIALGVASLSGMDIPAQVFAWIAVFILPLNAAINPILYTLSTAPFLGPARKRVSTFRRSFMTSMSGETHRTMVSTFADEKDQLGLSTCNTDVIQSETGDKYADIDNDHGMANDPDGEIIPLKALPSDRCTGPRRMCRSNKQRTSNKNQQEKTKYGIL